MDYLRVEVVPCIGRRHGGADLRSRREESLCLQCSKRLAHDRLRDTEIRAETVWNEKRSGLDLTSHYGPTDRFHEVSVQAGPARRGCRGRLRAQARSRHTTGTHSVITISVTTIK